MLISRSGVVLTAWHVVGHMLGDGGFPVGLRSANGRVLVAVPDSTSTGAGRLYVASVIDADIGLDMAVLRIDTDSDGGAVSRSFPFVPLRTTEVHLGEAIRALGYPQGATTPNSYGGSVSGIVPNANGEPTWLRTDAEFNHGISGGPVVDSGGRVVAIAVQWEDLDNVEPIELARPVSRLGLRRLRRDVRYAQDFVPDETVTGYGVLTSAHPVAFDEALGDQNPAEPREVVVYLVDGGPGMVRARPSTIGLTIADIDGTPLRSSTGAVFLRREDRRNLLLVSVPADGRPVPFDLTLVPPDEGTPPPNAPSVSLSPGEQQLESQWRIVEARRTQPDDTAFTEALHDAVDLFSRLGLAPGTPSADHAAQAEFELVSASPAVMSMYHLVFVGGHPATLNAYVESLSDQIAAAAQQTSAAAHAYDAVFAYARTRWTVAAMVEQARVYEALRFAILHAEFVIPSDIAARLAIATRDMSSADRDAQSAVVRETILDRLHRSILDPRGHDMDCIAIGRYARAVRTGRLAHADPTVTVGALSGLEEYGEADIAACLAALHGSDPSIELATPGEFQRAP